MVKKLTLQEIQHTEFEMLMEFSRICEQEGIPYSLDSGTLLGAIRHKDFVPWDDDIDVIVLRSDYNRLCEILPQKLPAYYKFEKLSQNPFAKIVDLRTLISNHFQGLYELDKHLWIDIFPIDGIPANQKKLRYMIYKSRFLRKMQMWARTKPGVGSSRFMGIAKIPFLIIPRALGTAYFSNKIEKMLSKIDDRDCEYVSPIIYQTKNPIIPRKAFENLVKVPFHGEEFWAIPNWNEYLTELYGDYMQLPPESERKIHLLDACLIE